MELVPHRACASLRRCVKGQRSDHCFARSSVLCKRAGKSLWKEWVRSTGRGRRALGWGQLRACVEGPLERICLCVKTPLAPARSQCARSGKLSATARDGEGRLSPTLWEFQVYFCGSGCNPVKLEGTLQCHLPPLEAGCLLL